MTTSSDSSVTKCETCGEARGATFFKRGHPGVEFHGEGMGHAFVPAPAPSSDPVSEDGPRGALGVPEMEFARLWAERQAEGARGFVPPVLSPTEAGELSDEDREWMDAPMGPPRRQSIATQLGAIYDTALTQARAAAYGCGYALAVHGSEMRDLDLIAVPWTDEATDAETLVAEIVRLTGGRHGQHPDEKRPHGRRSWSIHLNNEHTLGNFKPVLPYIDLSVMPRVEEARRGR